MKTALSIFFYTLIFAFLGAMAIAFAFHIVDLKEVLVLLDRLYYEVQMRIITGLSGFILILISLAAAQSITGRMQREKTIAFTNPNGQVTITLSAVEDLIKRLSMQMPELKEARADVKASKKGIDIHMRIILRSEVNIPDFTSRLQDLISNKIQEVFGIDEPINVKIHVSKIITKEEQKKKKSEKHQQGEDQEEINIPYQTSIKL